MNSRRHRAKRKASVSKDLKDVLSRDYKIPGISHWLYGPIFVLSLVLWIVLVPNWYLPGTSDSLLFLIFVAVMSVLSALSIRITRVWRRWRR